MNKKGLSPMQKALVRRETISAYLFLAVGVGIMVSSFIQILQKIFLHGRPDPLSGGTLPPGVIFQGRGSRCDPDGGKPPEGIL